MKRLCLALLTLSLPLTGVAAAVELTPAITQAFDSYCAVPGKLATILKAATDKESADKAAVQLKAALPKLYEARDLLHKMPALTPAQNQQVRLKYEQRMLREWSALYEQIRRVRDENCFDSKDFAHAYNLMCLMIEK